MTKLQNKVKEAIEKTSATTTDCIENIISTNAKVGAVVNRVVAMDKANVDHEVIALQMTKNSAGGNTYDQKEIPTLVKLHEDCKTRVPLSANSARSLLKDQKKNANQGKKEEPVINATPLPS